MKRNLLLVTLILTATSLKAQDELLELIDNEKEKQYIDATFKGTRVILGHSVKTKSQKALEFLVTHRFGRINRGAHDFFGLDDAWMRIALEYGILNNLNFGVGRSSFDKTYDAFLKYRIVQQSKGPGSFPLSVVLFHSFTVKTTPKGEDDPTVEFNDRLANVTQLLIASKLNNLISLQLMPTFVHKNTLDFPADDENQVAIGAGGRVKLTPSLAFNAEYYYRLDPPDTPFTNSFSVGFDIETGGHVFQLHLTNSIMTVERAFITETSGDFFDGDIHFGFNISRTFHLGNKDKKNW